jgi:hypothetical protein
MRELNRQDLQWALRRAPRAVLLLLKANPGTVFLGGGFMRAVVANEKINDVDLFVSSKPSAREVAVFLQSKTEGTKLHETENAFTVHGGNLHLSVQIIHRWVYTTCEELVRSFDFTIAMAGLWWSAGRNVLSFGVGTDEVEDAPGWRSVCDDRFYEDLAAKRLRYTSPVRQEDAGGSMLRVLKFYQKGYRIPLDSLGAVMARLAVDVEAFKILEGKAPDREAQLAKVFTGLLREVDPNIDPSHIAHLPADVEAATGDAAGEDVLNDIT